MLSKEETEAAVRSVIRAAASLGIVISASDVCRGSKRADLVTVNCQGINPGDSAEIAFRARQSLSGSGECAYEIWHDKGPNKIVIEGVLK